jgi:predicted nucleic acid-binding protein
METIHRNIPFKMSVVSYMEIVQGIKNKRELSLFKKHFNLWGVEILHIDEIVSANAMSLVESYFLSSAMELGDALIGATAVAHKQKLLTANVKHYKVIPKLQLEKFVVKKNP